MTSGTVNVQSNERSPGRHSSDTSGGTSAHGSGWIRIALGAAAIAAGVAAVRSVKRGRKGLDGESAGSSAVGEAEVERSLTIGRTAEELYQRWRDPQTLTRILSEFATVHESGDGRFHWRVEGPLGQAREWDSETVDDRPGESVGWRSRPDAGIPNEGSVRFRPAPADRGTVATLHLRFDAPDGALGHAATKLLGDKPLGLAAETVLRRFKSLVESGEIPTTERQPAARADTR